MVDMIEDLKSDLRRDEDVRFTVYTCPAGKQTIAVGRNLDDVPLTPEESAHLGCTTQDLLDGKALSNDQVDYLLDQDVGRVITGLDHGLPWWKSRDDDVRRGMANMAFQLGVHGLEKFKGMLGCLQAGDYAGARAKALDSLWARQTPERAERVTALFK